MGFLGRPESNGALYLPAALFSEDNKRVWRSNALVDTGAQFALVHPLVLDELGVDPKQEAEIDTALGMARARVCILRFAVEGIFDGRLSALESRSKERVVLGRQFLAFTRIEANWPARSFAVWKSP